MRVYKKEEHFICYDCHEHKDVVNIGSDRFCEECITRGLILFGKIVLDRAEVEAKIEVIDTVIKENKDKLQEIVDGDSKFEFPAQHEIVWSNGCLGSKREVYVMILNNFNA